MRRRAIGQILLLTAGFVVLVAVSTASVILVNKSREDNAWVVHTVEVENQTNTLLLEIRRAESAARGYLLTSGPEFLTDHKEAVAAIVPELDKLAHLVSDDPVQSQNVAKLRSVVEARLAQFAKEMSLIEQGDRASATASDVAAGSPSGFRRRIAAGTIASISAARDGYPSASSIVAWSLGVVPMWRAMNASLCSSAASVSEAPPRCDRDSFISPPESTRGRCVAR